MPVIPERQPIADLYTGVVLRASQTPLLAPAPLPGTETIASGNLVVRYAVQYLDKPHLAVVPGLIALDYGEIIRGEEAWDFLLHRSNLHPRADVVGYRNDGVDDMVAVKLVDPVAPIHVLIYSSTADTKPIARVLALIADDTTQIPPRLLEYLPRFESLEDWQQHE
jgi:hypothetical protein